MSQSPGEGTLVRGMGLLEGRAIAERRISRDTRDRHRRGRCAPPLPELAKELRGMQSDGFPSKLDLRTRIEMKGPVP